MMPKLIQSALALALTLSAAAERPAPVGELRKIAGGFTFTEGPAWHPTEGALYFSDIPGKTLHRWTEKDGIQTVRTEPDASNGIAIDPQGFLVFCEVGACRIVRRSHDGTETTLADRVGDRLLGHTNDLWIAPDGGTFFTVPNKAKKIPRFAEEGRLMGTILYRPPGDRPGRDVGAAIQIKSPNGVVGSADGRRLYYTDAGKCWVAAIGLNGSLANKRVAAPSGSDGLTLDAHGNLYKTAREKGVEVYDPGANLLATIPVPESPANMTFGGTNGRTLFITARTSVYAIELNVAGDSFQSSRQHAIPPSTDK